jgi:hypothetical protein
LFYRDEVSKIKKKLKTDRDTGFQPPLSKKPKESENEEEDSDGSESHNEMRRKT